MAADLRAAASVVARRISAARRLAATVNVGGFYLRNKFLFGGPDAAASVAVLIRAGEPVGRTGSRPLSLHRIHRVDVDLAGVAGVLFHDHGYAMIRWVRKGGSFGIAPPPRVGTEEELFLVHA